MDDKASKDERDALPAEDVGDAPLNRAERRHGARRAEDRPMPGKRGSFHSPFQRNAPGQKKDHSRRKTG